MGTYKVTSGKCLPIASIAETWTGVPGGVSHWDLLDETEDDLDLSSYIRNSSTYPPWGGPIEVFQLQAPPLPDGTFWVTNLDYYYYTTPITGEYIGEYFAGAWQDFYTNNPHSAWSYLLGDNIGYWCTRSDFADWRFRFYAYQVQDIFAFYARIRYQMPGHVTEDTNLFGQRFRAYHPYDDPAESPITDMSFQRLDLPGGSWSDRTHPFPGDGNYHPSIKCLPDGRLRCAYLDSDGEIAKAESYDDGETWSEV